MICVEFQLIEVSAFFSRKLSLEMTVIWAVEHLFMSAESQRGRIQCVQYLGSPLLDQSIDPIQFHNDYILK